MKLACIFCDEFEATAPDGTCDHCESLPGAPLDERGGEPEGEARQTVVYRIVHAPTGRLYVGVHATDDPDDDYMGSGTWLQAAIDKHGREQFRKDVLASCSTKEAAFELERGLVGPEQVASPRYFNLCVGGRGVVGLSEESLARMAAKVREQRQPGSIWRQEQSERIKSYMALLSEDERREVTAAARTPEAIAKATATRRELLDGMTPEERRALIAPALAPEAAEKVAAKNRARGAAMTPDEKRASTAHMNTAEARAVRAARDRAYWASMTPEERRVEGKRRRAVGLEKKRVRREVALIFLALVLDRYGESGATT